MSRRPSSPLSPGNSRHASIASQIAQQHAPTTPSNLRESHTVSSSPEDTRDPMIEDGVDMGRPSSSEPSPNTIPAYLEEEPDASLRLDGQTRKEDAFASRAATETTSLLRKPFEFITTSAHAGPCNHGTFSPGLESRADSIRSGHSGVGFGDLPSRNGRPGSAEGSRSLLGTVLEYSGMKNGGKKKMSTTSFLAERHGIKNTTAMYV
jgi:hypothetical protein